MAAGTPAGLEKKAVEEGRIILYSDECGVYLLPFVQTTWAPKGQTPQICEQYSYDHLSIMAALSPTGNLVYWCRKASFNGVAVADFLAWSADCYRRSRLIFIWDGATIHHGVPVRSFLTECPGKIHLEKLPAYSPELNPVELLWAYLKKKMANQVFLNLKELQRAVEMELQKIKKNRTLIRSFFKKPSVAFFLC